MKGNPVGKAFNYIINNVINFIKYIDKSNNIWYNYNDINYILKESRNDHTDMSNRIGYATPHQVMLRDRYGLNCDYNLIITVNVIVYEITEVGRNDLSPLLYFERSNK